jgi:rubrerythrin
MRRGWELQYEDGTIITEEQMDWKRAPKIGIVRLTLHYDGREWSIVNKSVYLQKKRASMIPGISESFQVESRSIGYYEEQQDKVVRVWYTVNENTGKMTMDVEGL